MENWREVKLGDICSVISDGLHGTPKYDNNGDYYFINGNNLNGKIVIKSDTKKVNEIEYNKYKKVLNDRTLFLSINGTIGNVASYSNEKVILGKSVCYINVNNDYDKNFIKYILYSDDFQSYISKFATGTTIKNVSLKLVKEYSFFIPPLSEQKRIASILSQIDDYIENTIKLIEHKELFKKGIAKKLLTCKEGENKPEARFKGFNDEWEEVKIAEFVSSNIIKIEKGKPISKSKIIEGDIPVIAGGKTAPYYHNQYNYDYPCITISASGSAGYVWFHDYKIWASDCHVLYTDNKNYNVKFLYYYLKSIQDLIYYLQIGGVQQHVYAKDIMTLNIPNITIKEQEKIAHYLSLLDEEIDNLKKQLKILKNIKKGAMKKLLMP